MKPKEAYSIVKKNLDDNHVIVGCKNFDSYYGFFISQNGSKYVGSNMITVSKLTRRIGMINIAERIDDFVNAKNIDLKLLSN